MLTHLTISLPNVTCVDFTKFSLKKRIPMPRNRRRAIALLATLSLVLASPTAAHAQENPRNHESGTDHAMGSQIRLHEATSTRAAQLQSLTAPSASGVLGVDVSHYDSPNWSRLWSEGRRFAWVKATEGTTYRDPTFSANYTGAEKVGMKRGGYHFARPASSSGSAQATFFSDHGGGWTPDGLTLPGVVDMEYNPNGDACYGMSRAAMAKWITDFEATYRARWGINPTIYTSTSWWNQCVGEVSSSLGPLWLARYASAPGPLPSGWTRWTAWQYSETTIDQDVFAGTTKTLAQYVTKG